MGRGGERALSCPSAEYRLHPGKTAVLERRESFRETGAKQGAGGKQAIAFLTDPRGVRAVSPSRERDTQTARKEKGGTFYERIESKIACLKEAGEA